MALDSEEGPEEGCGNKGILRQVGRSYLDPSRLTGKAQAECKAAQFTNPGGKTASVS